MGVAIFINVLFWFQKLNSNRAKLSLVQSPESESLGKQNYDWGEKSLQFFPIIESLISGK